VDIMKHLAAGTQRLAGAIAEQRGDRFDILNYIGIAHAAAARAEQETPVAAKVSP
jgi:hypothetical protein